MDREAQSAKDSWSHALWSLALWRGDNVLPQFHSLKALCHSVGPWLDWWSEYKKTANLPEIKKGQRNQVMNRPMGVLTGMERGSGLACAVLTLCLPRTHQICISKHYKESCCSSTWGIQRREVYFYQMQDPWLLKQQTGNKTALTLCIPIWHLVWQNHGYVFTLGSTIQRLEHKDALSVATAQKECGTDCYRSLFLSLLSYVYCF